MTIFRDAATGIIWIGNQVFFGAGETVTAQIRFEEWLWEQTSAEIKHPHSDNLAFTADMLRKDCKKRTITKLLWRRYTISNFPSRAGYTNNNVHG